MTAELKEKKLEEKKLKEKILALVREYGIKNKHNLNPHQVPVSGKVYDEQELINLVSASLEGWWTEGHWNQLFEEKLKHFLGVKFCLTTNSGSSANFLALQTLTTLKLKERRVLLGDEVITVAAAFPTTVNPILQIGAVPVFVDVELETLNIRVAELEQAYSSKTKAVILAHTLGNPFNLQAVKEFCQRHNLWLIEDNCDALGSKYQHQYTGTFGDLSTLSFYPAHQITTAEGGAVLTNNPLLYHLARSLRDWGRDCYCPTGKDDTCKKRFSWQLGALPFGYDHKYTYSEIGYNLKMTDLQAALGAAQMEKLPGFISQRQDNFAYLQQKLAPLAGDFYLPQAAADSQPSWFGFFLIIKNPKIKRRQLLEELTRKNIGTRLLFAGNITKQPYFCNYRPRYRQVGNLVNTDLIMEQGFWIGVYPGLGKEQLDYVAECLTAYVRSLD